MQPNMKKEYSDRFDTLRKNRVEVSFHKYGPAKINFGDKLVDTIKSHDLCIEKYKETGNTEYLLDAANYLMFEFMYPQKEGAYFKATDSSESAGTSGEPITINANSGKYALREANRAANDNFRTAAKNVAQYRKKNGKGSLQKLSSVGFLGSQSGSSITYKK